jgi:hypothetical protein
VLADHYLTLNESPSILAALRQGNKALDAGKIAIEALSFIAEDDIGPAGIFARAELEKIAEALR